MQVAKRIDTLQQQLVHLLEVRVLPEKSYLAGGTAVYFYLKHRVSIDLDFFTPERFNVDAFMYDLKNALNAVSVELIERDTAIVYLSEQRIKVSLFFLPYKLLSSVVLLPVQGTFACPCASLRDIAAMKALAISQRGAARDFVDLYFLLKHTRYDFAEVVQCVRTKYDLGPDYEYQLKTSFVYFDDAEREIHDILLVQNDSALHVIADGEWAAIKNFFVGLAS